MTEKLMRAGIDRMLCVCINTTESKKTALEVDEAMRIKTGSLLPLRIKKQWMLCIHFLY